MRLSSLTSTALVALTLSAAACGKTADPGMPSGAGAVPSPAAPAASGFTKARAQALIDAMSLGEGWQVGLKKAESDGFTLSWRGPENDRGAATSVIASGIDCMLGLCEELSAAAWQKNTANLKMKLSKAIAEDPKTVFEIVDATVDGKKAVGVYTLGFNRTTDATGTSTVSTHSFDLYWHDGAKLVVVSASASGASADSAEDLAKKLTRAELEATSQRVMTAILAKL